MAQNNFKQTACTRMTIHLRHSMLECSMWEGEIRRIEEGKKGEEDRDGSRREREGEKEKGGWSESREWRR